MSMNADQSDLDIQRILRAEIRALKERHALEITLIHAMYAIADNGPADGQPSVKRQTEILAQCPLFDADWYDETYPAYAKSGMSAAQHYVCAGAFAGHNPGPDFDTMAYYLANPDVAQAGWPALVHYLEVGQSEGRTLV
ncbi:hypothetical protein [Aurantiacibacter flavus]|uniref:Uncharacterized protein n=1 Tax=Aurantiacibacter flavus TaxID=3145232 RepID=A0ABV0CZ06_9SPHN